MAESLFTSPEQEYQTAGWLGTLRLMQSIGERLVPNPDRFAKNFGREIVKICTTVYQKPDESQEIMRKWFRDPKTNFQRINVLDNLGTVEGGRLITEFVDALQLNTAEPFAVYVRDETTFSRHVPVVEELTEHFSPSIDLIFDRGTSPVATLKEVQHNIAFYIGLYDRP